jgi:hypothetical protein
VLAGLGTELHIAWIGTKMKHGKDDAWWDPYIPDWELWFGIKVDASLDEIS